MKRILFIFVFLGFSGILFCQDFGEEFHSLSQIKYGLKSKRVSSFDTTGYGEGNDMVLIDGDTFPALVGTGTEDFFNTSWSPEELFHSPYFGYARVNNETGWLGHTHVYRFFITDPIYFDKSLRFAIEHGHANDLTLDLSSVAYWYQDKVSDLPKSFTREERQHKPLIGLRQIHEWREVWRLQKGNDTKLWANEIRHSIN